MNFLLAAILVVLAAILVVLVIFLVRSYKASAPTVPSAPQESKSLTDMAAIMRESYEAKKQEERDQELAEYAQKKNKSEPPPQMRSTNDQNERLVSSKRKNADLIPYGLTEKDKRILEEFNG